MKKKKIILVNSRFSIGGAIVYSTFIAKYFNNDNYETILIAGTADENEVSMEEFALRHQVKPILIPEIGREISLFDDLVALWKIFQIMLKEKPDIVHTNSSKGGLLGRIPAILLRVPLILHTYHGHVFSGYFSKLKTKLIIWIEKILAVFTRIIIVISRLQFEDICLKYKIAADHKFRIIPFGLELERFRDLKPFQHNLRQEYSIPEKQVIVGTVGRLFAIKNQIMFLHAIKKIVNSDRQINTRFIIVGDGDLRQELENYVRQNNLNDWVIFTGNRFDQENIYAALDVFVLTSNNEGTPVTLIEALACGIPVVCTRVGGIPDVLNNIKSILIEKGDDQNLADELQKLITDADYRNQFKQNHYQEMEKRYSVRRLLQDLEGIYNQVGISGRGY